MTFHGGGTEPRSTQEEERIKGQSCSGQRDEPQGLVEKVGKARKIPACEKGARVVPSILGTSAQMSTLQLD